MSDHFRSRVGYYHPWDGPFPDGLPVGAGLIVSHNPTLWADK